MEDWRRHLRDDPRELDERRPRRVPERDMPEVWTLGSGEGRISRSWRLLGDSWDYLRGRPRLLVLPALSMVSTAIAVLVLFVPTLYLTRALSLKVSFFVAGLVCAAPFAFITTFFNVGFLAMVIAAERGEQPTVRDGLRAARTRLGAILAWSLLSTLIGQALSALENLPGGGWLGRIVGSLGELAWGLATFFVVPILALDGTGAREAIRRSARTFRERWGETVTGDITIGAIFGLLTIPGLIVGFVGLDRLDEHVSSTAVILLAVAVVLIVPPLVLSSALTEMFTLSLYRYAKGQPTAGPFGTAALEGALKPKQPPWWRR